MSQKPDDIKNRYLTLSSVAQVAYSELLSVMADVAVIASGVETTPETDQQLMGVIRKLQTIRALIKHGVDIKTGGLGDPS